MPWLRRLFNTFRSSRMQREIERELSFHLAERTDQLRSEGLSDAEARRRARLRFGNPRVQAERTREVNVAHWADALLRNLRQSGRAIVRKPGFTATVVITLAVCIGANTAVFSAIDSVLLKPLPFPDGERLVLVRQVFGTETPIAPARLQDWTRLSSTFAALTGYYVEDVADTTGDLPERVRRAGVTPEQARADLAVVQARLAKEYPETDAEIGVRVAPYKETVIGGVRGSLWLLFGAVSVLLLIACTNIAALLLSRAAQREQEVALRFSLGASRAVVASQLLTETVLLAFAGAAAGLLVAAGASAAIRTWAPELPRIDEIGIDARILMYTLASAVVVALLCGVFPALRSTREASSLASGGRTQVSARHSAQWLLVGVQMALAVTLLAGAGLLLRSVEALARVDPGFDAANVLAFRLSANWIEEEDRSRLVQRIEGTLDEVGALPGVESAATAWSVPGVPRTYQIEFDLIGGQSESAAPLFAEWRTVSPGYFKWPCSPRRRSSWPAWVCTER